MAPLYRTNVLLSRKNFLAPKETKNKGNKGNHKGKDRLFRSATTDLQASLFQEAVIAASVEDDVVKERDADHETGRLELCSHFHI
jgi:hypothetical protein